MDNAGNVTIGNNLTTTNTVLMGSSFLRNRIINGDMRIDQRNAGASVTINSTANTYVVDRWNGVGQSADGVFTLQQSSVAPTGFRNSLLATVTTADASIGATQYYLIRQVIEGYNVADLGFGAAGASTFTLSFWVRSSVTGTFGGAVTNNLATYCFPFTFTISAANTWEQKTVAISGPTSGTFETTNGGGLNVYFSLGMGSTYLGTAGAWAATTYFSASGSTNLIATNAATFYITGVQLEVGSVATPFERRQYGQELALCQRYYEMSIAQGTTAFNNINGATLGVGGSANDIAATSVFKVTKRAAPTIVPYSSGTGTANAIRDYVAGADVTGVSTEGCDTGFRVYKTASITANRFYGYQWTASAEL